MIGITKHDPAPGVTVAEVEAPTPAAGEVLLANRYSGICGSDLATYRWDPHRRHLAERLPVVLGHEGLGTVVEVGEGVTNVAVGDRVVPEPVVWCGFCAGCQQGRHNLCANARRLGTHLPGTMANRTVVPAHVCQKVPTHLTDEQAALLEVVAVAMHGVRRGGPVAGMRTAVVGPGSVGLCIVQILKAMGAAAITVVGRESSKSRLEVAEALGATRVVCVDDTDSLAPAPAEQAEVSFEAAGSPAALVGAIRMTRPGGRAVAMGGYHQDLAIDFHNLVRYREIDILSSRARNAEDWQVLLPMLEAGVLPVGPLPMQTFSLEEGPRAFEAIEDRSTVKVLIDCRA